MTWCVSMSIKFMRGVLILRKTILLVEQIQNYFPPQIRENPAHKKYLIKEYIQLMILDFLAASKFVKKITFIGGTNLRLVKGLFLIPQ